MRGYGPRTRTDADRKVDALLFIFGATPAMIAHKTAGDICADKGVKMPKNRAEVARALLRRQMQISA